MPVQGAQIYPTYYDRLLLELVRAKLVIQPLGQKRSMPERSGRTIVFTRFSPLPRVENPLPPTGDPAPQTMSAQQVSVEVQEYGAVIDIQEFEELTAFVPLVETAVELLSYQASQSLDWLCAKEITSGTNVIYTGGKADRDSLTSTDKLTLDEIRRAVAILRENNVPTFPDGFYVGIVHPAKEIDLISNQEFQEVAKYADTSSLLNGEIGRVAGVRFVSTTNIPTFTNINNVTVYPTVILGQNAFGVVDLNGRSIMLKEVRLDKMQRTRTLSWRAYFAVKRLDERFIVRIESA